MVVGSSKGDVIALSEQDGALRWRVRINAEILSAAAIGSDVVVVRGVDGRMHGLSAEDGSENWMVDQQVPRLSLRGTSRRSLRAISPSAVSTMAASWPWRSATAARPGKRQSDNPMAAPSWSD